MSPNGLPRHSRWLMLHKLGLSSSKSVMLTGSRTFFTPAGFVWIDEALRPMTSRVLPQPFPTFQDILGLTDAGLAPISNPSGLASLTHYEHLLDNSFLTCRLMCIHACKMEMEAHLISQTPDSKDSLAKGPT